MTGVGGNGLELGRSRGRKKKNLLANSQLRTGDALKILSNGSQSLEEFGNQFIYGKNVMEVASGGYTDLVVELEKMGASSVVATDKVRAKRGSESGLYLRVDMYSLSSSIDDIRRKLSGNRPDTIIGTSFFGSCSLSHEDSRCWLKECCRVISPGGAIIVDFMNDWWCPARLIRLPRIGAPRSEFERTLNELVSQKTVNRWAKGQKANSRVKYKKILGSTLLGAIWPRRARSDHTKFFGNWGTLPSIAADLDESRWRTSALPLSLRCPDNP